MKRVWFTGVLIFLLATSCSLLSKGSSSETVDKTVEKENEDLIFQEKFFEAQKQKALGNPEKAYAAFLLCIEVNPEEGVVYYELARMDLDQNNADKAIENLNMAVALDPDNRWYVLKMAEAQAAHTNYKEAKKYYRRALELNTSDLSIYEKLVEMNMLDQDPEGAIKVYNELEGKTKVTESVSFAKYDLYMQSGKFKPAEEELKKLIQEYPDEIRFLGVLAEYYASKGEKEKAQEQFEKMKAKDPDNGLLHWQLAQHYLSMGDDQKGHEEFITAFRSNEIKTENKVSILQDYYQKAITQPEFNTKGIELSSILTETDEHSSASLNLQGKFYFLNENLYKANESFDRAVEQGNVKLNYWIDLLFTDYLLKDYEKLKYDSERALELFPVQPEVFLYVGMSKYRLGKYNAAIINLRTGSEFVLENDALKAHFYMLLADAYKKEGNNIKEDEFVGKKMKMAAAATYSEENNPELIDVFGKTMISKKYFITALDWYDYYTTQDPDRALWYERLGDVYFAMQQMAEAEKWWTMSLEKSATPSQSLMDKLK